MEGGDSRKLL